MSKSKKQEAITNLEPTKSKIESTPKTIVKEEPQNLVFGKKNYMIMLGGLFLIFLGLLLMSGGSMPSADVWDESLIYSSRRTILAPMVILAGLGFQFWAIFSKKN